MSGLLPKLLLTNEEPVSNASKSVKSNAVKSTRVGPGSVRYAGVGVLALTTALWLHMVFIAAGSRVKKRMGTLHTRFCNSS